MKKFCLIVIAALVILILYIVFGSKSVFGPTDSASVSNFLNLEKPNKEL